MANLTIGSLADAAGVGVETVRFYQRRGLLDVPPRAGGIRRYDTRDLDRIAFIKRAQAAGFTLVEIGALIALSMPVKIAPGRGKWPGRGSRRWTKESRS